jgi:hypothetical protein
MKLYRHLFLLSAYGPYWCDLAKGIVAHRSSIKGSEDETEVRPAEPLVETIRTVLDVLRRETALHCDKKPENLAPNHRTSSRTHTF